MFIFTSFGRMMIVPCTVRPGSSFFGLWTMTSTSLPKSANNYLASSIFGRLSAISWMRSKFL